MNIESGDVIGSNRVLELIGAGGMGAVYKTEHIITQRVEAMKLLPIGIGTGPSEERFEREIRLQAGLDHPNIAAVYNAVRDGGKIALIMEHVTGESLRRILDRGPLPLSVAIDYIGQALAALEYAHAHGVVHRDVTPGNILITPDGRVKLTDFGLAHRNAEGDAEINGIPVGSPWYMPPEQVRGEDGDARSDVYALGAVLHEMLTGRKLFDVEGSFALMRAQMDEIPAAPSRYNPAVSKALDYVVAKALAKNPAARFPSAAEFRHAIEAATAVALPRRRWKRIAAGALAGAAIGLAIAGASLQRGKRDVPPTVEQQAPAAKPASVDVPAVPAQPQAEPAPAAPAEPQQPSRASVAHRAVESRPRATKLEITGSEISAERATPAALPEAPRVELPPSAELPAALPSGSEHQSLAAAQDEEPSHPNNGNRVVRTLQKLNPFRRSAKD